MIDTQNIPTQIMTVALLADYLLMTPRQIYNMTKAQTRARDGDLAIPILKINGNLRFRKVDIDEWIERLAKARAR